MGHEVKNLYRASYLERTENKATAQNAKVVSYAFSIIKSLIIIRIFFSFLPNYFVPSAAISVVEAWTYPLVMPFFYLFSIAPTAQGTIWVSLFALIFYTVIGYLLARYIESHIASAPAERY
jgi:hypothetical protein